MDAAMASCDPAMGPAMAPCGAAIGDWAFDIASCGALIAAWGVAMVSCGDAIGGTIFSCGALIVVAIVFWVAAIVAGLNFT